MRDRQQVPEVLARRELGDDAAVFGVELELRGDDVSEHRAVAHDSGAGFVAGCFEGQQEHAGEAGASSRDRTGDRRFTKPLLCR